MNTAYAIFQLKLQFCDCNWSFIYWYINSVQKMIWMLQLDYFFPNNHQGYMFYSKYICINLCQIDLFIIWTKCKLITQQHMYSTSPKVNPFSIFRISTSDQLLKYTLQGCPFSHPFFLSWQYKDKKQCYLLVISYYLLFITYFLLFITYYLSLIFPKPKISSIDPASLISAILYFFPFFSLLKFTNT